MDTTAPATRHLATSRARLWPLVALATLLVTLVAVPARATTAADPGDAVERHLAAVADEQHLPGLAVAVVDGDDVRTHVLGEDGDGEPLTASTPFLLGSVSKSVTATAVLDLVDAGELTTTSTLGEVLPEHGIDDERADGITIEQLLTHTSGLTTTDGLAHADRFDNEPGALQRQATGLDDVTLARDPGAGYEYSDLGYLLLGAIVEETSGAPFGATITDQVLAPAGVEQAIADAPAAETLPPGHRQVLGRPVAFDSPYDTSGVPYGYVGTDLTGLAAWAQAQLGGHGITDATLAELHAPRVATGSGDDYGYGWRVGEQDGEAVVEHTGATPGYFTHVRVQPDRDRAVVVLTNSYSEARAGALYAVASDVQRILDGQQPTGGGADPLLQSAPFVVLGLAALGLVAAAVVVRGHRRRLAVVVLAVTAPVVALALLAPGLLGYTSAQLRLWAPDLGWGLWAVAGAWIVAALAAVGGLAQQRRRTR